MSEKLNDRTVDLCIVGGAGSGLAAAVRAKELGIEKVLLIEKNPRLGGCTRLAKQVLGINSPAQKRQGVTIDCDQVFQEHMKIQNWDCNARLVSRWFHTCGQTIGWIEDMGMEFEILFNAGNFDDDAFKTSHRTEKGGFNSGSTIVRVLTARAQELGVEIMLETEGKKLVLDDNGQVAGVCAEKDGQVFHISAQNTVIATGSISNNWEMIRRMMDTTLVEGANKIEAALRHNTGDGQRMAAEAGAKLGKISPLYMGPHNHPYSNAVCMLMRRPQMFTVNKLGERYVDESILSSRGGYLWMNGVSLNSQPDKVCFFLVDEACLSDMLQNREICTAVEITSGKMSSGDYNAAYDSNEDRKFLAGNSFVWMDRLRDDLQSEAAAGRVCIAQSIDEIADWIGAEPKALRDEVNRYNTFCDEKHDGDFGKDPKYLYPLRQAPFYAIKAWQGIDTLIGGVNVNQRLQALNENFEPIKGLYVVGVCASGFLGRFYGFPGTEMSFTLTSGYIAGEEIAKSKSNNE